MTQVSSPRVETTIRPLLVAARLWSNGADVDLAAVASLRDQALLENHRDYLTRIPAYARLAAASGIGPATDLDTIRAQLIVTDGYFKSYDPAWLPGDLFRLNKWLADISTVNAGTLAAAATNPAGWRNELREAGVYLTFSSGTAGVPSIVPRDRLTLAALRSSSGVRMPWSLPADGYDCLLLTTPGMGSGIQAGAAGLSGAARRVHHLEPTEPDLVLDFLTAAVTDDVPLLVYGSPAGLAVLAELLDNQVIPAPDGSCVVTGGGWKNATPADLEGLQRRVADRLQLPLERCRDTFSTAELNTVFVSCARRRYHVPPIVEAVVLGDDLTPLVGGRGRLAVLDPFAVSYPGFVATGDVVSLGAEPCGCGLAGQSIVGPIRRAPGAAERGCGYSETGTSEIGTR